MDGKLVDWDKANVHILTHTLHYGLGVFEGIRCYRTIKGSAIFRLDEHVDRLFSSAHIFNIEIRIPKTKYVRRLSRPSRSTSSGSAISGRLFISVMGLWVSIRRVTLSAWQLPCGRGVRILEMRGLRGHKNKSLVLHPSSCELFMTRAKVCGHYVNSQIAKKEAIACGYDEALLLDPEGYVSEGSGENIFIVRNGKIKTTPLTTILEGITRDSIIRIARDNRIPVEEERFTRDEIYIADEAFFTGTAAEVTPIREIDGRRIGIGSRARSPRNCSLYSSTS